MYTCIRLVEYTQSVITPGVQFTSVGVSNIELTPTKPKSTLSRGSARFRNGRYDGTHTVS